MQIIQHVIIQSIFESSFNRNKINKRSDEKCLNNSLKQSKKIILKAFPSKLIIFQSPMITYNKDASNIKKSKFLSNNIKYNPNLSRIYHKFESKFEHVNNLFNNYSKSINSYDINRRK